MQAQITFKSGAQITVDVGEINTWKDGGPLTALAIDPPDDWTSKLRHIAVDEIAAIVVLRSEEEAAEAESDD
jgi:hypothetical protein